MSTVELQVRRARWRLTVRLLLEQLCLAVLVAAALWIVIILAARLFAWPVPLLAAGGAAVGVALLVAVVLTLVWRPGRLNAAVTLDKAAGLKERISSALALMGPAPAGAAGSIRGRAAGPARPAAMPSGAGAPAGAAAPVGDPFVAAVVLDAERSAARLHVPAHVPHQAPAAWPWPVAALAAALVLLQFMPTIGLFRHKAKPVDPQQVAAVEEERVAISTELQARRERLRELIQKTPGMEDLAESLEPLEMPETPNATTEDVRREALKKIESAKDKIASEINKSEAEAATQMKRSLAQLQPKSGNELTARLSESLRRGDTEAARNALAEIKKQMQELAAQHNDPEAQRKLAELAAQLQELSAELAKLSNMSAAQQELENRAGLSEDAARKLLDELSKMDPEQMRKALEERLRDSRLTPEQLEQLARKLLANQATRESCKKMAQALAEAAKNAGRCQNPSESNEACQMGSEALDAVAAQMSEMEAMESLVAELEAELAELDDLKDCVGQGKCKKPGRGDGDNGSIGPQGPQYGRGHGARIGQKEFGYKRDPTKAKTRPRGGSITGQMLVDGPQVRGGVTQEALDTVAADVRDAQEAIERAEVPRQYQRVLREYFEQLAGLVQPEAPRPAAETGAPGTDEKE